MHWLELQDDLCPSRDDHCSRPVGGWNKRKAARERLKDIPGTAVLFENERERVEIRLGELEPEEPKKIS